MSLSQLLQIRAGLQNFFQPYSATILPTRTSIQKASLTKFAGGYYQHEAEFEIIVSAKRLARDNTDAQLGNVEREIQRIVCLYTPGTITGVDDLIYRGQQRIYGIGENGWAAANWATRIIIAVRYFSANENAF